VVVFAVVVVVVVVVVVCFFLFVLIQNIIFTNIKNIYQGGVVFIFEEKIT
jgi:hypothetical protein